VKTLSLPQYRHSLFLAGGETLNIVFRKLQQVTIDVPAAFSRHDAMNMQNAGIQLCRGSITAHDRAALWHLLSASGSIFAIGTQRFP